MNATIKIITTSDLLKFKSMFKRQFMLLNMFHKGSSRMYSMQVIEEQVKASVLLRRQFKR